MSTHRRQRRRWIRTPKGRLGQMATSIVGGQAATAILGLAFWTLAARGASAEVLSGCGAATAAMLLLGPAGMLGMSTFLISELPLTPPGGRRGLVMAGIGTAAVGGGLLGALLVALAPLLGGAYELTAHPIPALLVVAGCSLAAVTFVFDQVMLVVGAPSAQLWRNVVMGAVKVALLALGYAAGQRTLTIVLAAWCAGGAVSSALAVRAVFRHLPRSREQSEGIRAQLRRGRQHAGSALQHHALTMALASGSLLMPVVIGVLVSTSDNATYTTVRLLMTFPLYIPYAVSLALFASSAAEPEHLAGRARRSLAVSLAASLVLSGLLIAGAGVLLMLFGQAYAAAAATPLRIMALAVPLLVFKDQYIAVIRSQRRLGQALPWVLAGGILEVAAICVGAKLASLEGALVGWDIALLVQAAFCAVWMFQLGVITGRAGPADGIGPQLGYLPVQTHRRRAASSASGATT